MAFKKEKVELQVEHQQQLQITAQQVDFTTTLILKKNSFNYIWTNLSIKIDLYRQSLFTEKKHIGMRQLISIAASSHSKTEYKTRWQSPLWTTLLWLVCGGERGEESSLQYSKEKFNEIRYDNFYFINSLKFKTDFPFMYKQHVSTQLRIV